MSEQPSTSASVPTLRFPRPQGSQRLANWISTSSPDIMSPFTLPPSVDDDALAESSYEMINSDGETESQDGMATESTASSLDLLARPTDTDSLSETEEDELIRADGDMDLGQAEHIGHQTDHHDDDQDDVEGEETITLEPSSVKNSAAEGQADTHATRVPPSFAHWTVPPSAVPQTHGDQQDTKHPRYSYFHARVLRNPRDRTLREKAVSPVLFLAFLILVIVNIMVAKQDFGSTSQQNSASVIAAPSTVTVTATTTAISTSTATVHVSPLHDFARLLGISDANLEKDSKDNKPPPLSSTVRDSAAELVHKIAGWGEAQGISHAGFCKVKQSLEKTAAEFSEKAKIKAASQLKSIEDLHDDMAITLLKAQIQSRLIVLKLRGDMAEHKRYQAHAVDYLKKKQFQLFATRAQRAQRDQPKKSRWSPRVGWTRQW